MKLENFPVEIDYILHKDYIDPENKIYWEEEINGIRVWIEERKTKRREREIIWFCNNVGVVLPDKYKKFIVEKRYYELCEIMAKENPDITHPRVRLHFRIKFSLP